MIKVKKREWTTVCCVEVVAFEFIISGLVSPLTVLRALHDTPTFLYFVSFDTYALLE